MRDLLKSLWDYRPTRYWLAAYALTSIGIWFAPRAWRIYPALLPVPMICCLVGFLLIANRTRRQALTLHAEITASNERIKQFNEREAVRFRAEVETFKKFLRDRGIPFEETGDIPKWKN